MKKLTYSLILLLGISFFTQNHASESFENDTKVRLTIHNVGVGQCYDLEMYDPSKKKKKYMLIGFGIEENQFKDPSPESVSISSERSKVRLTPSDYHAPSPTHPLSSQELVKELRAKFKQENGVGEGIDVDTVILTHPMKDRGLLMDLFSYETDRLGQLWLAGLPEQYYEDKQDKFRSWLEAKKLKKTEIYFLAVEKATPGSIYSKENRKYKQACFTPLVEDGEKKLNFGAIKVSFLSVNPTHFQGYGRTSFVGSQEVLRSCFPEDTHSDSLLIKIRNGSTSVLLTGNATSLTTNRALNNYIHDPKSLQSNVLVASSYGSTFQGANDSEWLSKVNPEYVLISHGSSSLTLDQKAYDSFKELKRLKNPVTLHDIQVQVPQVQSYSINHAIFSTLNSGTITVDLYKKRLTVRTEKEKEISQPGVKGPLEKQASVFIHRPDHHSHSLLCSASPSPNAKSSPKIVPQKRERDGFSDYDNVSSSSQMKKSREKDLPRTQSLSLRKDKNSTHKEPHSKSPIPKKKEFSKETRKKKIHIEFQSDESSSDFNRINLSQSKGKNDVESLLSLENFPAKAPSKEIDTEVHDIGLLSVRTGDRNTQKRGLNKPSTDSSMIDDDIDDIIKICTGQKKNKTDDSSGLFK